MNKHWMEDRINRIEHTVVVRSIRLGLTDLIPILMVGAFALVLKTFPVPAYHAFIENVANGFFLQFLEFTYNATFGVLAVYMTYCISRSYMGMVTDKLSLDYGGIISSLIGFFILAGAGTADFSLDSLGPKSMFVAVISGLGGSALYKYFDTLSSRNRKRLVFTGGDQEFNYVVSIIMPVALTVLVFAFVNTLIVRFFHVDSFRSLIIEAFNGLFSQGETGFFKGFFFVLFSSVLWFFGIHGSDTLEGVMQHYFTTGLAINQQAVAAGQEPPVILTKGFFDCFVLMGGCGATICLLITILIFSRNKGRRFLGRAATLPMIFNINEMMVFGLPIIYNLTMLIPFLLTPLVCYSTAYAAMYTGLVPKVINEVEWTTPIILGGYQATGSILGSFLQIFNVVVGVLIYLPFVRRLDRLSEQNRQREFKAFVDYYVRNETGLAGINLLEMDNKNGEFAKTLCSELRSSIGKEIVLAYQPQYHYDGTCIGVEALFRWRHPLHGVVYPPLAIKLAEDGGFLDDMEEAIMMKALEDRPRLLEKFGKDIKLSINITGNTVIRDRFLKFCKKQNEEVSFKGRNICLEVTEQAAISFGDDTLNALRSLKEMGILLAIDDFSMGQTSVHYLRENLFDIIKLDGSMVRGMTETENYREIVSSITKLSNSLNLQVLAEYVETEDQRELLHGMGCDLYQGYLYSPAIYVEDF